MPWIARIAAIVLGLAVPAADALAQVEFTARLLPLSPAGTDQLQSVAAGPGGTFYAAGLSSPAEGQPRKVVVLRFTPELELDPGFGEAGVADTGMQHVGSLAEIRLALQEGRPIVTATIASQTSPADVDIGLVRLDQAGNPDASFGTGGFRRLDLSTPFDPGSLGVDTPRALRIGPDSRIYVHAVQRGPGRSDSDFAVVRLDPDGADDATWADGGRFLLDVDGSSAGARDLLVLDDGSVIAGGYAASSLVAGVQPVLFRLTPEGGLDPDFADAGVFHETVLGTAVQVYGLALHGGHLVTSGYGRRNPADSQDFVSLRFDAGTGERLPWGSAPDRALLFDVSGAGAIDYGRAALPLPGGRTVLIGSTGPNNDPSQDAALVFLDADGEPDPAFGGLVVIPPDHDDDGSEQLWGSAVSGDMMLFVGYRGRGPGQTADSNDDSYLVFARSPLLADVFADGFETP